MTTLYHVEIGALETQEFRTTPVSFWLICFSDTIKGPMRQMFLSFRWRMGRLLCRESRSGCRRLSREKAGFTRAVLLGKVHEICIFDRVCFLDHAVHGDKSCLGQDGF
jgi:hypothetical protein